jgi:hypothetical protein
MRVPLKGINSKRKRLADGTWRTYYWAWKGGPPLRGEFGSPEFHASYNEAVAKRITPPTGNLLSVLARYQASEDFRGLADSTAQLHSIDRSHRKEFQRLSTCRANRSSHTRHLHGMA